MISMPRGKMRSAQKLEVLDITVPAVVDADGKIVVEAKIVGHVLGVVGEKTTLKDAAVYPTLELATAALRTLDL